MTNLIKRYTKTIFLIIATAVIFSSLSGCALFILKAADNAQLTVSAAAQFGARGFYGDVDDVDKIEVYIFADPDNSGVSEDLLHSADDLVARVSLTAGNDWTAEVNEIPTMTDLRIQAYAYGQSSEHVYETINWTVNDNGETTDGDGAIMFTGTTSKYISSSTASIYLVMRPFNDGSLQRLPRLSGMTSNLNKAELRIDFNDYGKDTWPDGTTSYEKWFWRIIESSGDVASSSFSYEENSPESSILFDENTTQDNQSLDHDISLDYLFPDYNDDGIVDWSKRTYWLEIANPQHNILRQAFVMNPGSATGFDVNFAPWIRNITAGRYEDYFALDGNPFPQEADPENESTVVWQADVTDDTSEVRYIWILKMDDGYYAVYGDLSTNIDVDWSEWVSGVTSKLDTSINLQDRGALGSEFKLIINDTSVVDGIGIDSDGSFPALGVSPSIFANNGSRFDAIYDDDGEPVYIPAGELYLLVFDEDFEKGTIVWDDEQEKLVEEYVEDEENNVILSNIHGYDDYSWSYVRMMIDENSFPGESGGLIVFE